jgi:hypothetical protein
MKTELPRFDLHAVDARGLFFATRLLPFIVIVSICLYPVGTFAQAGSTSTICKFETGPQTGETHDYAPQAPLPVGSPCQYGTTPLSTGHVVAGSGVTSRASGSTSTICKFETGPQAGKTHDYAPLPPLPVGSPCQEGATPLNTGHIVASSNPTSRASGSTSTICKFETGPQAGKTHDYAPQAPLPVGSPCQDGATPLSAGHVVASSGTMSRASGSTSTICKFETGPQAGKTHNYAPQAPLPVGSPCQDGAAPLSTGHVVATSGATNEASGSTSTICKFETGPQAGKTHDYAPLPPLPVGSPCQDGATPLSTGHVGASSGATSEASGSTSTICKFETGPQAGKTHDYAPQAPLPVGSSCEDGATPLSAGHVVKPN